MKAKYLIIGNSAGGIAAAEAIRKADRKGSLVMVSDEPYPAYSRPLISKYLTHERTLESMLFRPADFYKKNNITCLQGEKVTHLGLEGHTAELASGESITWEKLLLATGGRAIVPGISGLDKGGVFSFITLDDAKAIDGFLHKVKRAVVIGGGLIGTSVTEALVKRGIGVSIVEMKERMLNVMLDETASLMAEEAVRRAGVNIITSCTVSEVIGDEAVQRVVLDNGQELPCEMVVVAIGVTPRLELVEGSGIEVNRGIVVNQSMATNVPGVYSCGDTAEAYDFIYGTGRLTPIWPNAYMGGRVAGYNMAGRKAEYKGGTAMNVLNYFGMDIASAGMATPPDEEGYEVLCKQNNGVYKKVVINNGLLKGMVFVGDIRQAGIIFGLMRDGVDVSSFKEGLLEYNFGLVSLPRELWQERLRVSAAAGVHRVVLPVEEEEDIADE